MCVEIDYPDGFIISQVLFNTIIMAVGDIMSSAQYNGEGVVFQKLGYFFGQAVLGRFHVPVQTAYGTDIDKSGQDSQMIGHFCQLFSNGIGTFRRSDPALISFDPFITGVTPVSYTHLTL